MSALGLLDAFSAGSEDLLWIQASTTLFQGTNSLYGGTEVAQGAFPGFTTLPAVIEQGYKHHANHAPVSNRLQQNPQHSGPAVVPSSRNSISRVRQKTPIRKAKQPRGLPATKLISACWRCRKYKKSCDNGAVCASCQVSGFRVWPSELGCRRERAHEMTMRYIPGEFEQAVRIIPAGTPKSLSWRRIDFAHAATAPDSVSTPCQSDAWGRLKRNLRLLAAFGPDMEELVDIAEQYQRSRTQPDRCLTKSCELLLATCQLYRCFVGTTTSEPIPPPQVLAPIIANVRVNLYQTFILLERLCLSAKATDWFAVTMSVALTTCAAIVFVDAMTAVPPPAREHTWGNYRERRRWIRYGSYNILIGLLQASTRGINPLKRTCFQSDDATAAETNGKSKYDETLLPPIDECSLLGGRRLDSWLRKNRASMVQAMQMFQMDLFEIAEARPIGALFKVFEW